MLSFGKKLDTQEYTDREAAYGILLNDKNEIALVSTPRGYFLPGGGIEEGESHQDCIVREMEEELGLIVEVKDNITSALLFDLAPRQKKYYVMKAYCYCVNSISHRGTSIEEDHELEWLSLQTARCKLKLVHQAWAVEKILSELPKRTLCDYNPHWNKWFEALHHELTPELEGLILSIEHIGSTAIPGMKAKPIIDIDIVMENYKNFDAIKIVLEKLGYEHVGDQGIEDREVFKRVKNEGNYLALDQISHHLYVCPKDSIELNKHLNFKKQLLKNDTLRDEYNTIKEEIIKRVNQFDRSAYVELKANGYQRYFDKVNLPFKPEAMIIKGSLSLD